MNWKSFVYLIAFFSVASCKQDEPAPCPPAESNPTPYDLVIPPGFPEMDIPVDNQMTVEGVALGKKLFYDKRLSADNSQACASCHFASSSFSDSARFSEGITGAVGNRNAMAIINLGFGTDFFWDGRRKTLEEQAFDPVTNPIEMNTTWPEVLLKLNADPIYKTAFKTAFGVEEIDSVHVVKAIAQFERTMISAKSPSDFEQLNQKERDGRIIFSTEKGDCFHCHLPPLFTGFQFENNGLQQNIVDQGVGGFNGNPNDIGKFKAPTLRNIALTAPYMHDGRFKTLEEVVEFYNSGVNQNSPNISPLMKKANRVNGSLNLTTYEKEALVLYLKSLTDTSFVNNPDFLP